MPMKAIYDMYRGRADSENRIKEIKYDFSVDIIPKSHFLDSKSLRLRTFHSISHVCERSIFTFHFKLSAAKLVILTPQTVSVRANTEDCEGCLRYYADSPTSPVS